MIEALLSSVLRVCIRSLNNPQWLSRLVIRRIWGERILFNLTELQATYGFVKRDERYRHQLEEAGLTQHQVVRIKVQGAKVKVRACLRKPWRLTTLKQKGAPLAVTDGTTTVPLALLDECAEIRRHQLL